MAHVLIKYSIPIYSGASFVDGAVDVVPAGWQNIAVSIRTNLPKHRVREGIYSPPGYYITQEPRVSLTPPKTGLVEVVTTSACFTQTAQGAQLQRRSGSQPGIT